MGKHIKAKEENINQYIQKRFIDERKIFLWGAVDDDSAKIITEQLFYMNLIDDSKDINFYINTPGGSITAGMAIYDTIQLMNSPVNIIVTGMAASMGSILLSSVKKGRRYLYPHASVLIHQPLIMGQIIAPAVDISIQAKEMERLRIKLNLILSKASGQTIEKISNDTDRDFYMNAQEAIAYGLADEIIYKLI